MTKQRVKPANGQSKVAERELLELIQEKSEYISDSQEPGYDKANILDKLYRMLKIVRDRRI